MSEMNSAEYYRGREQRERTLATKATSLGIAAIHTEMADRYLELIAQAEPKFWPRLNLRVVP